MRYTEKDNWTDYWRNNFTLLEVTPENSMGDFFFERLKDCPKNFSSIELGGFPGKFSIFLKKYMYAEPTLIDYFIDESAISDLLNHNGLNRGALSTIRADIFHYEPGRKFDVVFSIGLVEHFEDLEDVLSHHHKFLKPGGYLLIVMPNFRGLNGLIQYFFDRSNLRQHNLKVMRPNQIELTFQNLGLGQIKSGYYPSNSVWIENLSERSIFLKLFMALLNRLMPIVARIFGNQNRLISDTIVASARLK